jgi:hypothetical protein
MTRVIETFQDREARRRAPKALREGREVMNDTIRRGRPTLEERYAQRVMEDFDAKIGEVTGQMAEPSPPPNDSNAVAAASLDQGARGGGHTPGAHAPAPKDGSGALRQALREAREARGE